MDMDIGRNSNMFPFKKAIVIRDDIKPYFFSPNNFQLMFEPLFYVITFVWLEKHLIFSMHMKFNVFLNHQKQIVYYLKKKKPKR